ncbi:MAG: TOBE domain-containing protein, partial [Planctomycetota bacterium]
PPESVYNRPRNVFVAKFIGTPPMNIMDGSLVQQDGQLVFDEGDGVIQLPESFKPKLESYVGRKVIFGVRPEDVKIDQTGQEGLPVTVHVVELLGDQLIVYMRSGTNQIIGKLPPSTDIKYGDEVRITYRGQNVHIFETDTGDGKNVTLD